MAFRSALSSLVRLRPTGPWRFGDASGSRERVDLIFHSDALFSAVTAAMAQLGWTEEWLDATARAAADGGAQVRFSSVFPFQRDVLYVTPPRTLWPPAATTRLRYKGAQFVPLALVEALAAGDALDENRWLIDGESRCVIPARDPREGPFRKVWRSSAAVDRVGAGVAPYTTACLQFNRDAGLWTLAVYANESARETWGPRVGAAFRLLADSGIGGGRSRGCGRAADPEWSDAPALPQGTDESAALYWLLSLYSPAASDNVDWSAGDYATITRTGRVESAQAWGAMKPPAQMIAEGSVVHAADEPEGSASDIAPENARHPVYRAGFAVAVPVPARSAP